MDPITPAADPPQPADQPPSAPPPAPSVTPSAEPEQTTRRKGFVAQKPKAVRDRINEMLSDGFTYPKVIENLGDDGKGLKPDHIMTWYQGGFQEWLLQQERLEDLGATREAALSLVQQKAGATVQDASRTIASAQLYELLLNTNPRVIADALQAKPELYFRILTCLARLSEGEAACSRRRVQDSLTGLQAATDPDGTKAKAIPAEQLQELIRLIKLV